MPATPGRFVDPPWDDPLDVDAVIGAIPASATMAGMFFLAVLEGAERHGVTVGTVRPRYLRFGFYPVAEFAPLLVQAARKLHPDRSLRQALRALGTAGPRAFSGSLLGKVTLGAAHGVHAAVAAIANTYSINLRTSACSVTRSTATSIVVTLSNVHHFLDSHHVGVFEGTLAYAAVDGRVRISAKDGVNADLLLEWTNRSDRRDARQ